MSKLEFSVSKSSSNYRRQRAYKKDLELRIKQTKLDLDSLEVINKSFEDQSSVITKNAITSFKFASNMFDNIESSSIQAEKQGLV